MGPYQSPAAQSTGAGGGGMLRTAASTPGGGNWWNIGPLSGAQQGYWNQQLGANVNDILGKWNSFSDPASAFGWANRLPRGVMDITNIYRMANPVAQGAASSALPEQWNQWTNYAAQNQGSAAPLTQQGMTDYYTPFTPPAGKQWDPARGGWF